MPECEVLPRKHRQLCIGDLTKLVKLSSRTIDEPAFGSPNFAEIFSDVAPTWAKIETTPGKTLFDGVSVDQSVSHVISIRFDPTVTSETWVETVPGAIRYKIIEVEDLEERNEWLRLYCTEQGAVGLAAAEV
ncbi:unnamed protein product [marine sediment metagenome]|uniref:Phage head-tail adaptor n=1 Tax=marine sediment metagenome TaxID=412755 RepID=X0V5P9_9ZZZZ